jgi:hypothetical protein
LIAATTDSPRGTEAAGKTVIDAKAGRLDLVSAKATLYCAYPLDGGKLTIAVWNNAADRQDAPSTNKGGIMFVFTRTKKTADA